MGVHRTVEQLPQSTTVCKKHINKQITSANTDSKVLMLQEQIAQHYCDSKTSAVMGRGRVPWPAGIAPVYTTLILVSH